VAPAIPQHVRDVLDAQARNNARRVVAVTDYLLVTTEVYDDRVAAGEAGPVRLPGAVQLERIDRALAARLLRATELRGENWSKPSSAADVVHAYVRTVWREGDGEPPALWPWDADGHVYRCVQLSRLVRDNATSTEHAVRRLTHGDNSDQLIPFDGFYSHVAYRLYPEMPGWLDVREARDLATLVRAYGAGSALPARVGRALRRVDAVTRERYLEDALPLVVGALESLLKVKTKWSTQFAQRVPALARELDVALTSAQCRGLYHDRSALVHGGVADLSQPHERTAFEEGFVGLQETLRRAVRHAIEDPTFAAEFADNARITKRWPTQIKRDEKPTTIV
jgi:hypothetical protein